MQGVGEVIPTSNLSYIPTWLFVILELLFITFLTAMKQVKSRYLMKKGSRVLRDRILAGLTIATFVTDFFEYLIGLSFPLNSLIRPVYFCLYS